MNAPLEVRERKRALVTGAANGLGKSLTLHLAARGYEVVAVDIDEDGLFRLHHDSLDTIIGINVDFGDQKTLPESTNRILARGPFDMAFLVAGISATGRFDKIPAATHANVFAVNTTAPLVLANRLAAENAMNEGSSLVFVSSLSHVLGYPGATSYAASKDAVAVYARSVRRPFRKLGIKVCCTFPGPIRTDHAERHSPNGSNASRRIPPSRMAEKIVAAAMKGKAVYYPGFLAKLARITGGIFPVLVTRRMRRSIFEKLSGEVF